MKPQPCRVSLAFTEETEDYRGKLAQSHKA